jgi:hypothetical protein
MMGHYPPRSDSVPIVISILVSMSTRGTRAFVATHGVYIAIPFGGLCVLGFISFFLALLVFLFNLGIFQ